MTKNESAQLKDFFELLSWHARASATKKVGHIFRYFISIALDSNSAKNSTITKVSMETRNTHKRTRIILGHKSISLTVNYTYFGFVDFLENATTARKLLYAPPKKKKKKRYRPKIWAHAAIALSARPHTIYSAHFEQESHEKVHRIGRIKTRKKKIHA